jgi:regulator of sirC expression with transglutaminase-like and TPR domain
VVLSVGSIKCSLVSSVLRLRGNRVRLGLIVLYIAFQARLALAKGVAVS